MYKAGEKDIRSKANVKNNGEVFTPLAIVDKMLDLIPETAWQDPEFVFLEPTCGNGNFLIKIFERRIKYLSVEDSLNTIIAMDISKENIFESRYRLFELAAKELKKKRKLNKEISVKIIMIVTNNIFKTDSLKALNDKKMGTGILKSLKFVYKDPTGNNIVWDDIRLKKNWESAMAIFENPTEELKKLYKPFYESI